MCEAISGSRPFADPSADAVCETKAMNVGHPPHRVVAGLLRRGGRGLLLHRVSTRRWYPDCWDLPGSHVRKTETAAAALRRELREELGITADICGEPFVQVKGKDLRMDVWVIDDWIGEPANLDAGEYDALAWLNHEEMTALKLADPRLPSLFRAGLNH